MQTNSLSPSSSLSHTLRNIWVNHPKSRIALGAALLAGGLVATASGATAVAGVLLATRAGISALGGYITSTWLIDLISEDTSSHLKNLKSPGVRRAIGITAGGVAGILALAGASGSSSVLETTVWVPDASPSSTLLIGGIHPLSTPPIQDIFTDILQNHPNQWCVTLEQSVRRIEGLAQGISLSESENLTSLNHSVYTDIRTPGNRVYESLTKLGYLEQYSFEEACRRLSTDDIEKILTEAYGADFVPEIVSPESPSAVSIPPEVVVPGSAGNNIPYELLLKTGAAVGIAGAGYLGYRAYKKNQTSEILATDTSREHFWEVSHSERWTPTIVPSAVRATPSSRDIHSSTDRTSATQTTPIVQVAWSTTPVITPDVPPGVSTPHVTTEITSTMTETLPYSLSTEELRVRDTVSDIFAHDYEWTKNSDRTKHTPNEYIEFFEGTAYVGGYDGIIRIDTEGIQITYVYYDESIQGGFTQTKKISVDQIFYQIDPKKYLQEIMDQSFLELLLKRDRNKQKELTHIRGFIIPKEHGQIMYDHLEQPEVLNNENEVLGYWTSSSYHMQNGELLLEWMTNPKIDEQEFTSVMCKPKNVEVNTQYRLINPFNSIRQKLTRKEADIINSDFIARDTAIRNGEISSYIGFAGLAATYNWHKHPNTLIYPSDGDVSGALKDMDGVYPDACVYFYTIVVAVSESEAQSKLQDPTCLVLPKTKYGGTRSYIARSYKVFRGPPFTSQPAGAMQQIKIRFLD